MELSEKIQMLRKKEGLSQEGFAEKMGVSRQAVSKWELGVSKPDVDKILLMSKLFDVSCDYLLKDQVENDKEEKVIYYQEVKPWKFEKKSRHTLLGLPLYHICFQGTRMGGRMNFKMTTAKGVLAIGCKAKGILSIGIVARGLLSLGVASAGLFSFGAVSLGLISLGALSVGLVAGGNICVGVIAFGNLAVGVYSLGNCAVANKIALGNYAHAHIAIGNSVHGVKELLLQDSNFSDMNPAIVKKMILDEFPKTWSVIQRLFTMW